LALFGKLGALRWPRCCEGTVGVASEVTSVPTDAGRVVSPLEVRRSAGGALPASTMERLH
jgi:hypothetical protein